MKEIIVLPSFDRSIKKLSPNERQKLTEGLEKFNHFLLTGEFSAGFGFKKINHNKYEFRVSIQRRVVFKQEGGAIYLVLAGSHDEIRKYLKKYRNS